LNNILKYKVGETKLNTLGSKMTIISINGRKSITVEFKRNKYKILISYTAFKKGMVKNPYDKSLCGVGYLGEGKYIANINGKHTRTYTIWKGMFDRCYNIKYQLRLPTYINCTVCEEWYNFQNFGKWYDENYYEIENHMMSLDKDILIKGNKIYSPETCIFVPQNINTLFIRHGIHRGKYPIGVTIEGKKFYASCKNHKGKRTRLGTHNTPEEAFDAYKKYKENIIKQVAEEYKDRIPKKLYDAMLKYEVEITD